MNEIALSPLPTEDASPPTPVDGRFREVVFVRATAREKETIRTRAKGARLSVSRYLVHAALKDRAPASHEERERLRSLLYLFSRTGEVLERLEARLQTGPERDGALELSADLREAVVVARSLARELRRRL